MQHVSPPAHTISLRHLVAEVRAYIQIALLGFILKPIFAPDFPSLTMCYIFGFMVFVSVYVAAASPKTVYPNMFWNSVVSVAVPVFVTVCALWAVVAPQPWYCPQYMIPIAGMLINKAFTSIAPAVNILSSTLTLERITCRCCCHFGATPYETAWPGKTATFRQAMIPAINGMNEIGLVSIPVMMTGQILGGSSPKTAAGYQIVSMHGSLVYLLSFHRFVVPDVDD